jgi:hypothetical protein
MHQVDIFLVALHTLQQVFICLQLLRRWPLLPFNPDAPCDRSPVGVTALFTSRVIFILAVGLR